MVCHGCYRISRRRLCPDCEGELRPAADRILPGGVRLISAFEHEGPAAKLMHDLKYRGVTTYADLVAAVLRGRLPELPVAPVPRAWSRRGRYGVDPVAEIASRLSLPVLRLLAPPLHSQRRAGGDHSRLAPGFRLRRHPEGQVILLDDVVTSGRTLASAIDALGSDSVALAAAANTAFGQIKSNALRPSAKASS